MDIAHVMAMKATNSTATNISLMINMCVHYPDFCGLYKSRCASFRMSDGLLIPVPDRAFTAFIDNPGLSVIYSIT